MLTCLIIAPKARPSSGANQMRQRSKIGEQFRRGNASGSLIVAQQLAISLTLGGNLGPLLLGRPKGLFFGRSLRRLSASQITARHTVTPVLSARRSRYS